MNSDKPEIGIEAITRIKNTITAEDVQAFLNSPVYERDRDSYLEWLRQQKQGGQTHG